MSSIRWAHHEGYIVRREIRHFKCKNEKWHAIQFVSKKSMSQRTVFSINLIRKGFVFSQMENWIFLFSDKIVAHQELFLVEPGFFTWGSCSLFLGGRHVAELVLLSKKIISRGSCLNKFLACQ